jgi:hypothetical protein
MTTPQGVTARRVADEKLPSVCASPLEAVRCYLALSNLVLEGPVHVQM